MSTQRDFLKDLHQAWRDEMRSALNYRALAERETHEERKAILVRMAEAEERHAERWEKRLAELGEAPGMYKESVTERLQRWMLTRSSIETAAQILEEGESQADGLYERMLRIATPSDRDAILSAQMEEKAHGRYLEELSQPHPSHHPQRRLDAIFAREKWHIRGGGWIGQAIYGVNDGLGAAFGVVSGVAGATGVNSEFVLLSGFATMVASALSMGSGAWLATKSEREVYEAEIDRERREIESNPEEEREEMELFYQLKGFSAEQAKTMTEKLAESPDQFLKTLVHEELGLSEQGFPNHWRAAFSASISTAIGAAVPVLPFLFFSGTTALIASFVISTLAHFVVGASKVLVTGRSWLRSGAEMTLVGLGEAAITYAIGLTVSPVLH